MGRAPEVSRDGRSRSAGLRRRKRAAAEGTCPGRGGRWGLSEPPRGGGRGCAVLEIGSLGAEGWGSREATPSLGSAVDASGERARALLRAPRSARQRCGGAARLGAVP